MKVDKRKWGQRREGGTFLDVKPVKQTGGTVGSNSFIDYIFTGLLASIFSNVKNAKSIKMKLTNKTFPALTVEIEFVSICI